VTQLSLSIPKDKAQSPFLQLQATLRNADGKHTSLYLPAGVIHESLLKWLDESIIDGHLLRGDILVHGPTRKHQDEPLGVLLGFGRRWVARGRDAETVIGTAGLPVDPGDNAGGDAIDGEEDEDYAELLEDELADAD